MIFPQDIKEVPLIRGWDFNRIDYEHAWETGKLLTGQIELSNVCNLLCEYCFRMEPDAFSKNYLAGELSLCQTLDVVDEMASLGARAINIIGAGEPALDKSLPKVVEHISAKGIVPVVFTNGANLNKGIVDGLHSAGASVIIKVNSFRPEVQDALANRPGYTSRRDEGLSMLMEKGFNLPGPDGAYQTRLGIDSVICTVNRDEMLKIFSYCRQNNIMPLMKTFIPTGRTKSRTDLEVSMRDFLGLSEDARRLDSDNNIYHNHPIPYLGGVPCTQNSKASIYVDVLGDIFECPAKNFHYGNFKNGDLGAAFKRIKDEHSNFELACPARMNYWKRTY